MSDFSKSPLDVLLANQEKGYVGIHIEQGVPLLDRDLNLLQDLITAGVRSLVARYIGNGIAAGGDGFGITALPAGQNSQNFGIAAGTGGGTCLVGGIEVAIGADTTYQKQPGFPTPPGPPALTTPSSSQSDPRIDTVYLDVFLVEVDGSADSDLKNSQDVGMQTSVRLKTAWVVRVAEGVPVPPATPGHAFYVLAELWRRRNTAAIDAATIVDKRQRRLTVADIEQRLSQLEKLLLLPAFAPTGPQFIPQTGIVNQVITLYGSNFGVGALQVRFGTEMATIVGAPSATQVAVKVPPGLTPLGTPADVNITVSNAGGADTSDSTFRARPDPVFAGTGGQFAPNHGTPGTNVTLNGFNFNVGTVQVQFGTVAAPLVGSPTANQITVQVPSGLVPAGSTSIDVQIRVTTSVGTDVSDDFFKAELGIPAPLFATAGPQFTPQNGVGGQTVTLNGQNFNYLPVTVKFGDTDAPVSGSPSATQIAVSVPPNMTTAGVTRKVKITVTTGGGSVQSSQEFRVTGP